MKKSLVLTYLLIASTLVAHSLLAQAIQREVKRTSEKEVRVSINSTFGSVNIEKGDPDKIVQVFYRSKDKDDEADLDLDYEVDKGVGALRVEMNPEGARVKSSHDGNINVHVNNFHFRSEEWYVKLTDAVPLSIEAELGAGKSDFDFSGLNINELSISTGASSSKLNFDEKNKGEIDDLQIKTGVSKFSAENLNNANFRKMSFEGGVGSYYLNFSGALDRTVDVDVNVGLGAVTLVIPRNVGVKIRYEDSWLSNFTIDDDEFVRKKKGVYESENWEDARGRMNIFIESGLGSVKIRRTK